MTAVVALLAGVSACRSSPAGLRVVLITIDTLRYDTLAGGAERASAMPLTHALLERHGLRFERFYAASSTTQPSLASLLTGLHPWQHGLTRNTMHLAPGLRTVAEVFRDAGFETAAAVAALPVSRRFGFDRGFQRFDDVFDRGAPSAAWKLDPTTPYYRLAPSVNKAAFGLLDGFRSRRQFLWVHYFDTHAPYGDAIAGAMESPASLLERVRRGEALAPHLVRARELYEQDARALDRSLAEVLARLLADRAQYETHLVITADHGESFGEDGSVGHDKRLTPSQVHVPFVIISPRLAAGVRREVAGSVDVPATLFTFARIEAHRGAGRDLTQVDPEGGHAYGMRRTFAEPHRDLRIDGVEHLLDYDLFFAVRRGGPLYTGNGDGLRELAIEEPAPDPVVVEQLRQAFRGFQSEMKLAASPAPDETSAEILRAMGYAR